MASTYLSRTLGTPTDENRWTYSFWTKISKISDYSWFLQTGTNASNNVDAIHIDGANSTIRAYGYPGSQVWELITNAKYRDPSAWYHIVIAYNSDEATSSDRAKMWVNGVQQTSFSTEIYPSLGANSGHINKSGSVYYIGSNIDTNVFSEMLMTHLHFIDGTAYDASAFGETDATTGIWKPKTSPSVTYGTNGFFLKMENSGSMGTDSSGNANNFTVNGTLTQTIDSPSNVYCCLNALAKTNASMTFNHGNTTATTANGVAWLGAMGTLGANKGKWYAEAKITDPLNFSIGYAKFGGTFNNNMNTLNSGYLGIASGDSYGFWGNGASANLYYGSVNYSYGSVTSANDIMMLAMDLDNGNLYWGKNGTWFNSSNPATSTSPAISGITVDEFMTFAIGVEGGSAQWNFGNGYFGTTAVASAGSNGNGAIFEYDVPTGYYALNTKNLATYG